MKEELTCQFKRHRGGRSVYPSPSHLAAILSNERLFFIDLYKAGIGEKIGGMFREMLQGPGAVAATLHKYVM